MPLKFFPRTMLPCLLLLLVYPAGVFAEKVKPLNPDCDVCPTAICYEGNEARELLGMDGMRLLLKLKSENLDQKTNKIDLDGKKPIGLEKDPDEGYELLVFSYKHLVAINSLQDTSTIKIETDFQNLKPGDDSNTWMPEIQLMPPNSDAIQKTDDLETAWKKMKASRLYIVVNHNSNDHKVWKENLSKTIRKVLEAVTGD